MFSSSYIKLKEDRRIRYMVAGIINTAIGYVVPIFLYFFLCELLPAAAISALAACICISIAFVMYKFFVFRTKGNWAREYARCYIVYGTVYSFCIVAIWVMVDLYDMRFWIAQTIATSCIVVVSYIGHEKFTFATAHRRYHDTSSDRVE